MLSDKRHAVEKREELRYEGGVEAFVKYLDRNKTPLVPKPIVLKADKGGITVAGRDSPYALYQPSYATFGKDNVYNQKDAEGFIHLYGLAIKIGAGLDAERQRQVEAVGD